MSARSTGMFSLMHRYCCLTREPQLCSRLKPTPPAVSVAENTFTGIDTRPKLSDREAIERAAMTGLREGRGGRLARNQRSCTVARMKSGWLSLVCHVPGFHPGYGGLNPCFFIGAASVCFDVKYAAHGSLLTNERCSRAVAMVHCAPLFNAPSWSHSIGIDTPIPGRARAENAAAVVAAWPLRR